MITVSNLGDVKFRINIVPSCKSKTVALMVQLFFAIACELITEVANKIATEKYFFNILSYLKISDNFFSKSSPRKFFAMILPLVSIKKFEGID